MKTIGTIAEIKESHQNVARISGDRVAVIVQNSVSPRRSILGVQFWTKEMIAAGSTVNTDHTPSIFVEVL